MSSFIAVFFAWFFSLFVFLFFFGGLIFSNVVVAVLFLALIGTVVTLLFEEQAKKIETLEARLSALEKEKNP